MSNKYSEFDISKLIRKIQQMPGALRRELEPIVKQEAKLFVKAVVGFTPPSHSGVTGGKAKLHGESIVARDIYKIYRSPSQAYDAIAALDQSAASAFWFLYHEGDYNAAWDILSVYGGREFSNARYFEKFDGGALHKRFRNRRGRIAPTARAMVIVTNAPELKRYVRMMQKRVGLLASGWQAAAVKMGVQLPAWVARHGPGNGGIAVEADADSLVIIISNKVKYGVGVDLQRRADYVMGYRRAALRRRLPYVLRAALKKSGIALGRAAA